MNLWLRIFLLSCLCLFPSSVKADFGDADFPAKMFDDGPKSYHDAWCRKEKNKCRVRFQGSAMWVEGQGGIQQDQFINYRYEDASKGFTASSAYLFAHSAHHNYVSYKSKAGDQREALFIFSKDTAQKDFMGALIRWSRQESKPIPNYRLPNSQGPQDTQGRDKGLNPYDNPPITDWSINTTSEETDQIISPMDMD